MLLQVWGLRLKYLCVHGGSVEEGSGKATVNDQIRNYWQGPESYEI